VPPVPAKIGNYEIVRQLGSGGMGTVYLGRDPELDRLVAIKMLRDQVHDQELLDRFFREARAAAALRHPNIVTVYASGQHEFQPYIAMEFIDGESMADLIRYRRPITLADKLSYIDQLCAGLGFAHRAGIVHRDIKPANLMIDREGVLRILDFGIARVEGSGMTRDGAMIGTLNYMSPEQMLGRPVDHRSDIFAVGAVAYELLSYHQAFKGGLSDGLLQRLPYEDPPPLRDLCPGLPAALEQTVMRALQKSPDRRFQNLAAMRDALAEARRQAEVEAALETIVIRPPGGPDGRPPSSRTPAAGAPSQHDAYGLLGSQAPSRAGGGRGAAGIPSPRGTHMPAPTAGPPQRSRVREPQGPVVDATLPLGTSPHPAAPPTPRPLQRRLPTAVMAGAALLAGAAALPWLLWRTAPAVPPQPAVVGDPSGAAPAGSATPPGDLVAAPSAAGGGTTTTPITQTSTAILQGTTPTQGRGAAPPAAAATAPAAAADLGAQLRTPPVAASQPAAAAPAPPSFPPPREDAAASDAAVMDVIARVNGMYAAGDIAGALSVIDQNPRLAGDPRIQAVARRVSAAAFDVMASAERAAQAQKATDVPAYRGGMDIKRRAEDARAREAFVDAGLDALQARDQFQRALAEAQQRAQPPPAAAPATAAASPSPPPVTTATLLAQEQPAIVAALNRWAAAYEDGDIARLKLVFPQIRREAEQALTRSFNSNRSACRSFDVRFGRMEFSLNADGRRVTVEVPTEYVCTPKTGQAPPTFTQRDLFFLEKQGNDWFITQTSRAD
jgi:serine/threonine protein kinase